MSIMYIVYMQVLNGCLAASNRRNWCPVVSVYITCIYRCVLCSCMHTHDSTFVLQVLER